MSRALLVHLGWSALLVGGALALIAAELGAPCPPGGPIAFGDCVGVRPFAVGVVALATGLYVAGLSAVLWWSRGLRSRGVADAGAPRDWYLLAAGAGLVVAPLLAFTLLSAFR